MGTRTPPSQLEPFDPRKGVRPASGHVSTFGPLSLVKIWRVIEWLRHFFQTDGERGFSRTTSVLFAWPLASSAAIIRPKMLSMWTRQSVSVVARAGGTVKIGVRQTTKPAPRGRPPPLPHLSAHGCAAGDAPVQTPG